MNVLCNMKIIITTITNIIIVVEHAMCSKNFNLYYVFVSKHKMWWLFGSTQQTLIGKVLYIIEISDTTNKSYYNDHKDISRYDTTMLYVSYKNKC